MIAVVYTTFPSLEKAQEICRALLEQRLIACANIQTAPVTAMYRWQDKMMKEAEWSALLKTSTDCVADLTNQLLKMHPSETPCILSLAPDFVEKNYAQWILGGVQT